MDLAQVSAGMLWAALRNQPARDAEVGIVRVGGRDPRKREAKHIAGRLQNLFRVVPKLAMYVFICFLDIFDIFIDMFDTFFDIFDMFDIF